jgi:choline dehydrogenase-like flavoprotein
MQDLSDRRPPAVQLPTQGAANPALTIMALATRAAHRLATRQVHADTPTPAGAR